MENCSNCLYVEFEPRDFPCRHCNFYDKWECEKDEQTN